MNAFLRVIVAMCVCGGVCGAQDAAAGDTDAEKNTNVLLAFEKTRFKDALIEKMEALLAKEGIEVRIVDHKDGGLEKVAAEDYHAVFITNSGVNSKVRPWVQDWLKKNSSEKDRILLHTTQRSSWEVKAHVQAVTSASTVKKVDEIAERYVKLLTKIYSKTSAPDPVPDDG